MGTCVAHRRTSSSSAGSNRSELVSTQYQTACSASPTGSAARRSISSATSRDAPSSACPPSSSPQLSSSVRDEPGTRYSASEPVTGAPTPVSATPAPNTALISVLFPAPARPSTATVARPRPDRLCAMQDSK